MSDDEDQFNAKCHKKLLQGISSLGKTQHIRKSTRDEPKLHQDEFQLVKGSAAEKSHHIGVNDIVNVLKGTKKHLNAGKQLKTVVATKKVLKKPLEKPAIERIKRGIGYENVKKKLSKWNAIVAKNRSAETQVFPLKGETIYVNTSVERQPLEQSIKSELMIQMEELENKYAQLKREQLGDTDDPKDLQKRQQELFKKKVTKRELMAKRRELAYLRRRESQKSIKARLQNKIKSKKYHKLLKRQKMQEQIKQFELLQKTNPEAALEKLNAIEKTRVLERASLRHKNTGTWAKNLQIRAKYDKDVRKDLAEQLQISRQLTQKNQESENEMDENKEIDTTTNSVMAGKDEGVDYDPFNPWTKVSKNTNKMATAEQEEQANWRKYWLERNNNEKAVEEYKKMLQEDEQIGEESLKIDENDESAIDNEIKKFEQKTEKRKNKKEKHKARKSLKKNKKIENGWLVEELDPPANKSIDDIFDTQEDIIKENLSKKLKIINNKSKQLKRVNQKQVNRLPKSLDPLKNLTDLSFKNESQKPVIDEELTNELDDKKRNNVLEMAKDLGEKEKREENVSTISSDTIDPTKLAVVNLKQSKSAYGTINEALDDLDMDEEDAIDADCEQQMTIAQAFEDDDVVADFSKDKTKDSETKDDEIQLSMPGWGSWAGAGISKEQMERRNKRLLLKLAPKEKRRDDNKDGVYINEEVNKHLRSHLVSNIPFPFTSVKDYEASIRAPLGRNFVTETSFRLLTRPSVITQKGKIIEPMDESELWKPRRKLRNPVDIRIAKMSEVKTKA